MKKVSALIKEYHLTLALALTFTLLIALTPFLYFKLNPNRYLGMMSLRCLTLNLLCGFVFGFVNGGKFRKLIPFAALGALFSLFYLKSGLFWSLIPCLALTITSVIMTALVAFSLIEVEFKDKS